MINLLLQLLRLLPFLCGGHRQLAIENLALRQQLAVHNWTATRPRLRTTDRLFWLALARVWRQALVIVTPDTVLRWQRRRFREYRAKLSNRPIAGRPAVTAHAPYFGPSGSGWQRLPPRSPRPHDVICQTQTPATQEPLPRRT